MTLSPPMREALQRAAREPLRRVHDDKPGKPAWPAHHSTLSAAVNRGLLEHSRRRNRRGWWFDEWTITEAGRKALQPPVRVLRDSVKRLRVAGGSTRFMQAGEWTEVSIAEPEPMTPGPSWRRAADLEHEAAQSAGKTARRLARKAKAA